MNSKTASVTLANMLDVPSMVVDPEGHTRGYAILAVDDSDDFLAILTWYLRKCEAPNSPFRLSSVGTLAQAKEFLETHQVDCVILDVTLPDARNLDGLRGINEVAHGAAVVVVTALDEQAVAAKAIQAGAQDIYQKSPQLAGLDKILVRAMQRQAVQNAHREQAASTEAELRAAVEVLTSQFTRPGQAGTLAPLRARAPTVFAEFADTFSELLLRRRDGLVGSPGHDGPQIKDFAIRIGYLLGGGVDIVHMHREAMKIAAKDIESSEIVAEQSRLLSFQVLADLADFYRSTYGGEPREL